MLGVLRRNPRFRRLWVAQIVSELGDWMSRVGILAVIGHLGGAREAGAVGMLYAGELAIRMLPASVWGPVAGPLADRVSRKALMILTDVVRSAIVLALLLVNEPGELPILYGLLIAQMSASTFFQAARQAAVPGTVGPGDLHSAYTFSSATWSTMLAVGACTGAVLIKWVGPYGLFALDSVTYALSAAVLLGVRLGPTPTHPQRFTWPDLVLLRDIRRGWEHARERGLIPAILIKTFWGGAGGFLVLLSLDGVERAGPALHGNDPSEALGIAGSATGLLFAARGIGTGLGPILGRIFLGSSDRALRMQVVLGFLLGAIGYVVFGLVEGLPARMAVVTLAHMGGGAVWVSSTMMWQRYVDDGFRGRVFACEFLGFTVSLTLGACLGGFMYDNTGSIATTAWTLSAVVFAMGFAWTMWSHGRAPTTAGETR